MSIQLDGLVIDRVKRGFVEDFSGNLLAILDQLSNVDIKCSSESKDKKDANGALIKRFYTSKSVELTAETSLMSLSLMSVQFGSPKISASAASKLTFPASEFFTIVTGTTNYIIKKTPLATITKLYTINPNGTKGTEYSVATTASASAFAYDSASHTITLPTGATGDFLVRYDYASANGVSLTNNADVFPSTCKLTLDVFCADACSVDTMRYAHIVFPSFQMSPDNDIKLTTDSTFQFNGTAQVDYCSPTKALYAVLMEEDDIVA